MSLTTKPSISNRQFKQLDTDEMSYMGINNFLGLLKINNIQIDVDLDGNIEDYNGYALVFDDATGKISLKQVITKYSGIAERNIGGITEGKVFIDATMSDMWDALIMEEKFPVLTNPAITTFTASETGFREVGAVINSTFNITFNRGKIEIISNTNPSVLPRSGDVIQILISGAGGLNSSINSGLTHTATLSNYTVVLGSQTWNGKVTYDIGLQPKTSYGNDYNTPYPAGSITSNNAAVTGVYPYFATTSNITTLTKRPLAGHGTVIDVSLVSENGSNKQMIRMPNVWGVVSKIEQFNDLSNQWDVINVNSFTASNVNVDVNGTNISYRLYTHNGSLIGARRLRFTF